jgi:hypothetical protein
MGKFSKNLHLGLLSLLVLAEGCAMSPPVQGAAGGELHPERAQECYANCQTLGMRLSAVVVMMNHAGCVCEPLSAPTASPPGTTEPSAAHPAGALGGGAATGAIMAAAAAAAAHQQVLMQQQMLMQQQQRQMFTPTYR